MLLQILQAQPALSTALSRSSTSQSTPHSFSSVRSHDSFVPIGSPARSSHSTQPADTSADAKQQNSAEPLEQSGNLSGDRQTDQVHVAPILQPDLSDPFQQSVDALHAEQTLTSASQAAPQQAASQPQHIPVHTAATTSPTAVVQPAPEQQSPGPLTSSGQSQVPVQKAAVQSAPSVSSSAVAPDGSTEAAQPSPVGSASTDAWEMVQVTATAIQLSVLLTLKNISGPRSLRDA